MLPAYCLMQCYMPVEFNFFAIAVVLLGYFVVGTAGFGSALILVPLLA